MDDYSRFYHAYENYLTHAFPHDELKPLTKSFTYSLSELGNPKYSIRVLGGLVSAHILATDSANRLVQGSYKNQLLTLAEDLGSHFLPAFNTPTGLPYAWINLKVMVGDISAASSPHRELFHAWQKFRVLPERYLLDHQIIHPTKKYNPLRPEFAESRFYLYQATKGASIPANWTFPKVFLLYSYYV
ncbi:hypothetical protein QYF36_022735 [Acer negundo]|nr:hypothetical protein QYF36_022735 [Acer negundo]